MFSATVGAIAIAGCLCLVCMKIGYKTGSIQYIQTQENKQENKQEKEEKKEEKQEEEVKYNSGFDNITKTIKLLTIDKLASGSGKERMSVEAIGMSLFKYSPIFGIGFCSYRTFSLFTNIMLNMGILGICSFLYILFVVLRALVKARKECEATSVMFFIAIVRNNNSVLCRCA